MVQTVCDQPGTQVQVLAPLRSSESYSSLAMYERCPRSYAFRYVERLPGHVPPGRFAFGSAVIAPRPPPALREDRGTPPRR